MNELNERMKAIIEAPVMTVRQVIMALEDLVAYEWSEIFTRNGEERKITKVKIRVNLRHPRQRKALRDVILLLAHNNLVNRPLDHRLVEAKTTIVLRGLWKNGLSVIKFSSFAPNGDEKVCLIAGQHRLYGFLEALRILDEDSGAGRFPDLIEIDLGFGYDLRDAYDDNVGKPANTGQYGKIDQLIHGTEYAANKFDFAMAGVLLDGPGNASRHRYPENESRMEFLRPILPQCRLAEKAGGIKGAITPAMAALLSAVLQPDFRLTDFENFLHVMRNISGSQREQIAGYTARGLQALNGARGGRRITKAEHWTRAYNVMQLGYYYYIHNLPVLRAKAVISKEVSNGTGWQEDLFPLPQSRV